MDERRLTAFTQGRLLARGGAPEVEKTLADACLSGADAVLVFDDESGSQVDLDLRPGRRAEAGVQQRNEGAARKVGRPPLGVVAREVTLLPRHWEWLSQQPGGASVTLRKLVDAARKSGGEQEAASRAKQAADRFMSAALGNAPGFEEASRALYRGDGARFAQLTEGWPADLRDYARRLAAPAFVDHRERQP